MTEPFQGTTTVEILPQGSSLRSQPWAMRRNSFGVHAMANPVACGRRSVTVTASVDSVRFVPIYQKPVGFVHDLPLCKTTLKLDGY
jgi:hypothetical protein